MAEETDTLTLTFFQVTWPKNEGRPVGALHREIAERLAKQYRSIFGTPTITERTYTYRVGDAIRVYAFGRLRPGVVTKLHRSQITVSFARNQRGERAVRRVSAIEIRPEGEPW